MKRVDLERHLRRHGCTLLREGGSHAIWKAPEKPRTAVPRHREIAPSTARSICRRLGVPRPR
ncbi:MAG: type II toxin-antitoxin system HicA family toxin [Actinobacteria bacterium]|nr:type II toxin-antitoxin system HicA family toxin [Actinomycetota bacterium]